MLRFLLSARGAYYRASRRNVPVTTSPHKGSAAGLRNKRDLFSCRREYLLPKARVPRSIIPPESSERYANVKMARVTAIYRANFIST